jgi:hypothetical protein
MNIIDTIENFNIKNVYFTNSLENTVMDNGIFSKIVYSTEDISINGIYLLCNFTNTQIEKIGINKFKVSWNKEKNKELMKKINNIEKDLLEKYGKPNNNKQLASLLEHSNFRLFTEKDKLYSNSDFLLRISGIWENNDSCGITYKFLELCN